MSNEEIDKKYEKNAEEAQGAFMTIGKSIIGALTAMGNAGKNLAESVGNSVDDKVNWLDSTLKGSNLWVIFVLFFVVIFLIISTILTIFVILGSIIAVSLSMKINKDMTGFPRTVRLMKAFAMNWWYVFYGFIYLSRQK